jgi:hypothetical protein
VGILESLSIDYMLTGSIASGMQGLPRLTHDIDLVVALSTGDVDGLFVAFDPRDYELSRRAIDEAIRLGSMFNLLEYSSGGKVDFWLLTDSPFDRSRFTRKQQAEILGLRVKISTPEDTILAKLCWADESGGSEKQLGDARGILELQGSRLDLDYIDTWAVRLGVEPLWKQIQSDANPL